MTDKYNVLLHLFGNGARATEIRNFSVTTPKIGISFLTWLKKCLHLLMITKHFNLLKLQPQLQQIHYS